MSLPRQRQASGGLVPGSGGRQTESACSCRLRLASNLARHLSRVAISLYDVAIVLPLLVERMVVKAPRREAAPDVDEAERTHA